MMESPMLFWLTFYLLFFLASSLVGYYKNQTVAGVLLGYVFGPIGLLLLLMSSDKRRGKCKHCGSMVDKHAYYCPKCKNKCFKQLI